MIEQSPDDRARVLARNVASVNDALQKLGHGTNIFPCFVRKCLEKRVWEHTRIFDSGSRWEPVSFYEWVHGGGPCELHTTYARLEAEIERSGDVELALLYEPEAGRRVNVARPIPLASIRRDGGTQSRVAIDPEVVAEYSEHVDELPAVVVFAESVGAAEHWLSDGFHRVAAHEAAGRDHVLAFVKAGGRRDAILHAVGANAAHGVRRTHKDKQRAVGMLLADPEWGSMSNRWIAETAGVHHKMVGRLRDELAQSATCGEIDTPRVVLGQDGKEYVQTPKPTKPPPAPSAPVAPVARTAPAAPVEVEPPTPPPRPTNGARQQALPAFEVEADPVEVEAEPVAAVPPEVTRALDIVGALAAAMAPEHRSMFLHYSRELFQ